MNLFWAGLLIFVPIPVLVFTWGICRSAGMADDAMERMRANNYKGRATLDPPRYSEPITQPLKSTPIQS